MKLKSTHTQDYLPQKRPNFGLEEIFQENVSHKNYYHITIIITTYHYHKTLFSKVRTEQIRIYSNPVTF